MKPTRGGREEQKEREREREKMVIHMEQVEMNPDVVWS